MQELLWLICNNADTEAAKKVSVKERVPTLEVNYSLLKCNIDLTGSMPSPRILKSHLPIKYWKDRIEAVKPKVVVIMRNPKDTMVSYYFFIRSVHPKLSSLTWEEYFHNVQHGNIIYGDCLEYSRDWWETCRGMHNVMFVKYEDLKVNLEKCIKSLAVFLGKSLLDDQVVKIAEHTSFNKMKENPATNWSDIPEVNQKVSSFQRKGQVGDWQTLFTKEQNRYFDEQIRVKLSGTGLTFRYI